MFSLHRRALVAAAFACAGSSFAILAAQSKPAPAPAKVAYPAPRFPAYLKPPSSVQDLLPKARNWARNKSVFQGEGLGIAVKGDHVALVVDAEADDLAVEAVRRAMEERGVKTEIVASYTLMGVSRDDVRAIRKARFRPIEEGYMEVAGWMRGFPDPDAIQKWLQGRRPDLHDKFFPKGRELSPALKAVESKMQGAEVGKALSAWLDKNPDVKGIFWGKGGSSYLRRYLHPHERKMLGLFMIDNRWDLVSEQGNYPSDVWQLSDEQTIEPLPYIDKIHITDPEGTDVSTDLTTEQATKFSRGVFHRGHNFMWPNQAYGRFGYSVVEYPSFQKEWLSPEPMVRANGVVAGTGHGGASPRIEVHYKDGFISEVKGGGLFGDGLREFMNHYEPMSKLVYRSTRIWATGRSTKPRSGRSPRPSATPARTEGNISVERQRSGFIHWGIGRFVQHAPNAMTMPKEWMEFTKKNNVPIDHGFHIHTSFSTYRVRLRGADEWVDIVDKGRLTTLDNVEVRRAGLALRRSEPDLRRITSEIPGINPGGPNTRTRAQAIGRTSTSRWRNQGGHVQFFYLPRTEPLPRQRQGSMNTAPIRSGSSTSSARSWCSGSLRLRSRFWRRSPAATITRNRQGRTGAVLPGADVVVTNTDTGQARSVITDTHGLFTMAGLPPGPYEIKVSMQGLSTEIQQGLVLAISQQATIPIVLKVGQAEESLTVVASRDARRYGAASVAVRAGSREDDRGAAAERTELHRSRAAAARHHVRSKRSAATPRRTRGGHN